MSAWLCRKGTLSLVVDVIKSDDFKEYSQEYQSKSKDELIEVLADLNTKSLDYRYGESEYHVLQDRTYISLDVEPGQRHKSVGCYTYQTCEDPANDEHPLFAALEKWYADNDEKYDAIWDQYEWDIDRAIERQAND